MLCHDCFFFFLCLWKDRFGWEVLSECQGLAAAAGCVCTAVPAAAAWGTWPAWRRLCRYNSSVRWESPPDFPCSLTRLMEDLDLPTHKYIVRSQALGLLHSVLIKTSHQALCVSFSSLLLRHMDCKTWSPSCECWILTVCSKSKISFFLFCHKIDNTGQLSSMQLKIISPSLCIPQHLIHSPVHIGINNYWIQFETAVRVQTQYTYSEKIIPGKYSWGKSCVWGRNKSYKYTAKWQGVNCTPNCCSFRDLHPVHRTTCGHEIKALIIKGKLKVKSSLLYLLGP